MKFWCATAFMNTRELVHISHLLDQAGYHGLMISDHLCYPKELTSKYPYSPHPDGRPIWEPDASWPDPFVLIGAMSSVTTNLHFTTNVYIAGHRPILQVAKEVATAAVLTDGRVALGVGAGWMKEEFDLQGQDYSTRGKRLNEWRILTEFPLSFVKAYFGRRHCVRGLYGVATAMNFAYFRWLRIAKHIEQRRLGS